VLNSDWVFRIKRDALDNIYVVVRLYSDCNHHVAFGFVFSSAQIWRKCNDWVLNILLFWFRFKGVDSVELTSVRLDRGRWSLNHVLALALICFLHRVQFVLQNLFVSQTYNVTFAIRQRDFVRQWVLACCLFVFTSW
jgi:hypothetical protein